MNELIKKIVEQTELPKEIFPIDFFFSDAKINTDSPSEKTKQHIYVQRYNQRYNLLHNSHRPISKMIQSSLIIPQN